MRKAASSVFACAIRFGEAAAADPEAEREAASRDRCDAMQGRLAAQELHRANQACGALELLRSQHAQRVAHQNVRSVAGGLGARICHQHALVEHVEGHDGEVGFRLAAAGWKPNQVDDVAISRVGPAGAAKGHQKKCDLERAPGTEPVGVLPVLRVDVPRRVVGSLRSDDLSAPGSSAADVSRAAWSRSAGGASPDLPAETPSGRVRLFSESRFQR